jgi:hypothetical protein
MYVWYGTNEHNFEKLKNPPAYRPTRCAICGRTVRLGTDNYTRSGDDYWCESCAERDLAKKVAGNRGESDEGRLVASGGKKKIGRNDPCPCGSGKKYKRCCYGKETAGSTHGNGPAGALQELREAMKGKEFGSLKELQAFAGWHTGQKNRAPVDDFQGLSPEQMHRFLHFPFTSADLVTFPPRLTTAPEAPITKLFALLTNAMGQKGFKATAKGNLPLNFVKEAALAYLSDEERSIHRGMRSETDFFDLHVTRLVSTLAGFIRKYRGRLLPTAKFEKLMVQGGMAGLYPPLFRAFVEKYNWGYRDLYPDFRIIQQSFLFSLRLFHRYGDEWRTPAFYEDCFLRAFPTVLAEAESERFYTTPENAVRACYTWRCLEGFAVFFGLMDIEREQRGILDRQFRLKKTSVLDEAVVFSV